MSDAIGTRANQDELPTTPEPKKAAPTRRELEAALEALAPTPEPEPTPAEVERKRRGDQLGQHVVQIGEILRTLGILDSKDLASAQKAVAALGAMSKSAAKAIESIPDAKLGLDGPTEVKQKISRAPKRESVPAPEPVADTPAVLDEPAEKTLPGKGPDEVAAELREKQAAEPEPETGTYSDAEPDPEQIDAGIKANRAQRYQGRSVAPSTIDEAGPRGAVDPNANDGF